MAVMGGVTGGWAGWWAGCVVIAQVRFICATDRRSHSCLATSSSHSYGCSRLPWRRYAERTTAFGRRLSSPVFISTAPDGTRW